MNLMDINDLCNSLKMARHLNGERPISGLSELYDAIFLKYIFPIMDCSRLNVTEQSWQPQDINMLIDSPIRGIYARTFDGYFKDLTFPVRDKPVKNTSTITYMDCARICYAYIDAGFVNVGEDARKKFLSSLGGAIELYFETFREHDDYVVLASIAVECAKRGGVPLEWIIDIVSQVNSNATLELIHVQHSMQGVEQAVSNIRKFEL